MILMHNTTSVVALILWLATHQSRAGCAEPQHDSRLEVVAFGSCAHQDKPQPIWQAIIAKKPQLFLFLGDTVYADSVDPEVIRAAYAKLEQQSGYQQLRDSCPILPTWDDHDYGINDGGSEHPNKKESQRAFLDFFRVPQTSPLRTQQGVYQAELFGPSGQRAQVIMLDTRYHRGRLSKITVAGRNVYVPDEKSQNRNSMLGQEQWEWLAQQLKEPAQLRLIVSSIQVLPIDHPFEKWHNLPHERRRLLELLCQVSGGVLLLSGDQHLGEVSKDRFHGFEFWELTSSGLTHHRGRLPAPNSARVGDALIAENFGLLEIDWEQDDPLIRMTICDIDGKPRIQHERRLADLVPPH
jgi:alkaline phosphatase D